jgi:hypothetical protein
MKTFGNLFLMTLLCVAIFILFMGIRPAPAQQWSISDIGRSHGYVTGPGMPKCNKAVSEECRRLYPDKQARRPTRSGYDCGYNYVTDRPHDARVVRLAEEIKRRGGGIEAVRSLRDTPDYRSIHRDMTRSCGRR